ncbi:MAG TPA: Na+/H+ antiporter [Candidatus Dormibacteraeota bacterium]|nr:Na+/H+ antiporter [Candidatus Dormibacteraeota bacterium]
MSTNFTVEFLIWMMIAASVIAVLAARLRIPYTVALVLGGLALGSTTIHLPIVETLINQRPDWLTPDVTLVVFLPALLFEGSLKLQLRQLRENALPILLLATVGVLAATLVTGFAAHWILGLPILVALVFGAITAATDPISVLSIFKETSVPKRLSIIVEGESLFNDGTSAVLYGILVAGVASGTLGIATGIQNFFVEVLGGIALGGGLGYIFSKLTQRIDEPQIEITLTTVLAYGSYLSAQSLHVSGVMATVAAGVTLGNVGTRIGMSPRTRIALWSFWEYFSFVVNSLVFLLIGMQVHAGTLLRAWRPTLLALAMVVLGRVLSVYGLVSIGNMFSVKIPLRWQHILVAGGIRGALSLALVLSLASNFPYREQLLTMTFGVVAMTIIFQGFAIKPLMGILGIGIVPEDAYELARVQQISISAARTELDDLYRNNVISGPAFEKLGKELETRLEKAKTQISEIYGKDANRILPEIQMAKMKLIAAEKSSLEEAVHNGLITRQSAGKLIEAADQELDKLSEQGE